MRFTDAVLRLLPWIIAAPMAVALVWQAARNPRTPDGIERAFWLRARRRYWKRKAR